MPIPLATIAPNTVGLASLDDEARAAYAAIPPDHLNFEQAGVIVQKPDGKYYYTNPIDSQEDHFSLRFDPTTGEKLAALYHTHPGNDPDVNMFSPQDVQVANQLKLPSYVDFIRQHAIRKYIPGKTHTFLMDTGDGGTGLARATSGDPLSPAVKPVPKKRSGGRMRHFDSGGYNAYSYSPLDYGLAMANSGLGLYGDLRRGGVQGALGAAANAGNLSDIASGSNTFVPESQALGAGLGLYNGIRAGGVAGDSQAALSAARLGLQGAVSSGALSAAGAAPYMGALGYAAAPLELYNFAKNWQSGNTGADALSGAETGASIGSTVGPEGTIIGGLAGGAIGAISSAFGGGKPDPETEMWNSLVPELNSLPANEQQAAMSYLSPSQSYEGLAGVMDAKTNAPGSSEELEQKFGRMGENSLMDQMAQQINDAYSAGKIAPGENASQVYSDVVTPWLNSQGVTVGMTAPGKQGMVVDTNQADAPALNADLTNLVGDYMSGSINPYAQLGIGGQQIKGLPWYAGVDPTVKSYTELGATPLGGATHAINSQDLAHSGNQNQYLQEATDYLRGPVPAATGGSMKRKNRARITGNGLHVAHFDNGGSVGSFGSYGGSNGAATDPLATIGSYGLDSQSSPTLNYSLTSDPSQLDYGSSPLDQTLAQMGTGASPYGDPSASSSGGGGGAANGVSNFLQRVLGLSAGTASTLGSLGIGAAELSPILASLLGNNGNNATPPPTPAGYSSIPSIPTPNYSRPYTGPTTSSWSPEQWYKYGEGPEQSFFGNNQMPYVPGVSPANAAPGASAPGIQPHSGLQTRPVMAEGGAISQAFHGGPGYVKDSGEGDGTSDDINAKLSGGEYVMDAGTVSMLGNGSNEAGARKLDQLRQKIRKDAGKHLVKGKQFMKAKDPAAYLPQRGEE